jgi:hypothetical protein
VATLSLAQISSDLPTPEVKRVGVRLACLCGSCKMTVGDCNMLGCGYSGPARSRIRKMQAEGKSDDQIVAAFVAERGPQALSAPPNEGFNALSWWMPPIVTLLGLAIVWMVIRRMLKPAAEPATTPADSKLLDKYKDSIEKDLAKLE